MRSCFFNNKCQGSYVSPFCLKNNLSAAHFGLSKRAKAIFRSEDSCSFWQEKQTSIHETLPAFRQTMACCGIKHLAISVFISVFSFDNNAASWTLSSAESR